MGDGLLASYLATWIIQIAFYPNLNPILPKSFKQLIMAYLGDSVVAS